MNLQTMHAVGQLVSVSWVSTVHAVCDMIKTFPYSVTTSKVRTTFPVPHFRLFEIAPDLFPFKNEDNDEGIKKHGSQVMTSIDGAITLLHNNNPELADTLIELGIVHNMKEVQLESCQLFSYNGLLFHWACGSSPRIHTGSRLARYVHRGSENSLDHSLHHCTALHDKRNERRTRNHITTTETCPFKNNTSTSA